MHNAGEIRDFSKVAIIKFKSRNMIEKRRLLISIPLARITTNQAQSVKNQD